MSNHTSIFMVLFFCCMFLGLMLVVGAIAEEELNGLSRKEASSLFRAGLWFFALAVVLFGAASLEFL